MRPIILFSVLGHKQSVILTGNKPIDQSDFLK